MSLYTIPAGAPNTIHAGRTGARGGASGQGAGNLGVMLVERVAVAAGSTGDVTAYAVDAFPFRVRCVGGKFVCTTASTGLDATLRVRTAAAAAGTEIVRFPATQTGVADPDPAVDYDQLITPSATVGLFVNRQGHSSNNSAGTLFLYFVRE